MNCINQSVIPVDDLFHEVHVNIIDMQKFEKNRNDVIYLKWSERSGICFPAILFIVLNRNIYGNSKWTQVFQLYICLLPRSNIYVHFDAKKIFAFSWLKWLRDKSLAYIWFTRMTRLTVREWASSSRLQMDHIESELTINSNSSLQRVAKWRHLLKKCRNYRRNDIFLVIQCDIFLVMLVRFVWRYRKVS